MVAFNSLAAIAMALMVGSNAVTIALYDSANCVGSSRSINVPANTCHPNAGSFNSFKYLSPYPDDQGQRTHTYQGNSCNGKQSYCTGSHVEGDCFSSGSSNSIQLSTEKCS